MKQLDYVASDESLHRSNGTAIRILTIADEPSLVELLSMAMCYEGWEVFTASTGSEAVQVARKTRRHCFGRNAA